MFISLIVPVYNSSQYLDKCLASIKSQTFNDYEVIMVDDGSTDDSGEICLRACEADNRFKLLEHRTNRGASAARNTGVDAATGTYITFLDNDDWIEGANALSNAHKLCVETDWPDLILHEMGSYWPLSNTLEFPTRKSIHPQLTNFANATESLFFLIRNNLYHSSACEKIVKRSLLQDNGISFDEKVKHNEDSDWSCRVLCLAKSLAWLDESFYVYRRASDVSQSSRPITVKVLDDIAYVIEKNLRYVESNRVSEQRKEIALNYLSYIYLILVSYLFSDNTEPFKARRKLQHKNVWLLKHGTNSRVRLANLLRMIGGYGTMGHLAGAAMSHERKRVKAR